MIRCNGVDDHITVDLKTGKTTSARYSVVRGMNEREFAQRQRDKVWRFATMYGKSPAQSALPDYAELAGLYAKITEEESRMKQIDFAKPVRITGKNTGPIGRVEVVKEGLTLVRHHSQLHVIDEHGRLEGYNVHPGDGTVSVENVPEPKQDHLVVYPGEDGKWRIDGGGLCTKEYAERMLGRPWYRNGVAVKVEE